MKKIILILIGVTALVACKKEEEGKKNPCMVVNSEAVPTAISSAFQTKYQNTTVEKWFNKDNAGYSALFVLNGKQTLSQFNNDGKFVKEEIEVEQEGNHQDGNDSNSGCDCETGGKD